LGSIVAENGGTSREVNARVQKPWRTAVMIACTPDRLKP
jgi:hypothetical protein